MSDTKDQVRHSVQERQLGIVLSPEILQSYREIDQALPALIVEAIDGQLHQEYRYALGGQIVAGIALVLMAGGFVFLVMNGHETPAYVLLGAGVLNTVGGFLRARLGDASLREGRRESKHSE